MTGHLCTVWEEILITKQELDVVSEKLKISKFLIKMGNRDALDWEIIYEEVFKMSADLRKITGPLDYYDPDTTYEADVRAYVDALDEYYHNQLHIRYMYEKETQYENK